MPQLTISSIVDYQTEGRAKLSVEFEEILDAYKERIANLHVLARPDSDLKTIYVQFQFGCSEAGIPGAVRGIKLGRYSSKHRDVSATVEVPIHRFADASPDQRLELITAPLFHILNDFDQRYSSRLNAKIVPLIEKLQSITQTE